jgi:hypothetical protein
MIDPNIKLCSNVSRQNNNSPNIKKSILIFYLFYQRNDLSRYTNNNKIRRLYFIFFILKVVLDQVRKVGLLIDEWDAKGTLLSHLVQAEN